ncbi:uncharacterized protein [Drosophila takahashii]|uniref:uncharacterized protein isoform X14 n=1 Tax=Drosophila takahashii TaxID=29030 RepID=UPI003898E277
MSPKKLLRVRVKNIKKKVKVAAESTAKNAKGPGPYSELCKNPDLSLTVFDEPEATDGNVEYCENDFEDSGSNYSDNKSESESDDEFLQSFKNNEKKRSSFGKIQRKRWTAEEINALTIEFGEPAQILKLPYLKKMHRGNQQESPS